MPTPNPGKESHEQWMSRCLLVMKKEGREHANAVATCLNMWRQVEADNDHDKRWAGRRGNLK